MSRARELSRLGNVNAIAVDSDYNVGLGTSVSIKYKLDVVGDANFTGVITATSFGGDGSNLTGVAATDYIDASSITSSGIVSVTNTTASTSSATGALIVSGGVGIAGSLHVGENVSVGGTLTYEDVTNIDSVGLITARLGVNVSGGEIAVGAAFSVGQSGVSTAAGFVGPLTGAVTGNVTGNISGGTVAGSTGTFTGDVDIADKIVHTGDTNCAIRFPAADTISAETAGVERFRIDSSGRVGINTDSFNDAREALRVQAPAGQTETFMTIKSPSITGSSQLYFGDTDFNEGRIDYNHSEDSMSFHTVDTERARITKTGGLSLDNGELIERCYINSTAWSTNGDIDLDNGMVQYNSANLAGTNNTLNITSSVGINTQMATGDIISVTAITAVNATSAYVNHITIDHIAVTENWVGGSAPSAGGGSGLDTYSFNIIKTGSAAWKVIANQVLTSS